MRREEFLGSASAIVPAGASGADVAAPVERRGGRALSSATFRRGPGSTGLPSGGGA
ncbi:MAG TPA: hypothetical protein VFU90_10375 [Candidatus Tumulicola sp.]|nr:hypothetical protein [Candidatus Tumulicola sp.]